MLEKNKEAKALIPPVTKHTQNATPILCNSKISTKNTKADIFKTRFKNINTPFLKYLATFSRVGFLLLNNEISRILQLANSSAIAPAKSPTHFDFVDVVSTKYTP